MAITKIEEKENELIIKLDNGDFIVLEEIKKSWKFLDKERALRFAIAILKKAIAGGKKIYVEENGEKVALKPSNDLLEQEEKEVSK